MVFDIISSFITGIIIFVSIFTPQNPTTTDVILEKDQEKLVLYNYSSVTYSSPFALDYSNLLLGDIFVPNETKILESNYIRPVVEQKTTTNKEISFDWLIDLERKCSLPNNAKLQIITPDSKYLIEKTNSEFKVKELSCEDCDITIIIYSYPESKDEVIKFYNKGEIKIELNKNILSLLFKGYASMYQCLQEL